MEQAEKTRMMVVSLGKIPYDEALQLQETCHAARREGRIGDVILLLEHDPVITFGRSAEAEDLLVPEIELERQGIPIRHVNRGGKITCHYPGQLVGYFIVDLAGFGMDIHAFVRSIEETLIRVLADYGIAGERVRHRTGVWVGNDKVAALGIEVRNRVTLHGFSLNVRENAAIYSLFIPCGIADRGVSALERLVPEGRTVDTGEVREGFTRHWPVVSGKPVAAVLSRRHFEAEYLLLTARAVGQR
jgi:lipoyl(octanoyl) transferase